MDKNIVTLPASVMALAEAQAAKGGHSVDEYLAELIIAQADRPVGTELEAELLKGVDSPGREFSPAAWSEKRRRFEENQAGGR